MSTTTSRPIRESKLERAVCKYARSRGWWETKFVSPGTRAVPDRLFIRRGCHVFIELKRPGEVPTPQQYRRHAEMRGYGAKVYWTDNLEEAQEILF